MTPPRSLAFLLAVSMLAQGCVAAARLHTPMPEPLSLTVEGHPAVFIARTGGSEGGTSAAAFHERLQTLLENAGVTMLDETDVAATPPVPGDLVVRLAFADTQTSVRQNDCMSWVVALAAITAYLSALACVNQDDTTYAHTPVQVRVFDAEHAVVTSASQNQELVTTLDTSQETALVHDDVTLELEWLSQTFSSAPSVGPDVDAAQRAEGERMADELAARLIPDLVRAEAVEHPDPHGGAMLDPNGYPGSEGEFGGQGAGGLLLSRASVGGPSS